MKNSRSSYIGLVVCMVLFGSIGLFVRNIPLPSSLTAFTRGIVGAAFLMVVLRWKGRKLFRDSIRSNGGKLLFAGAFLGLNWVALFESYRYTSVAVSTLCYYMAPVLVILVSPLILKEALTRRKILCILAALLGAVLISGALDSDFSGGEDLRGILLGLMAAVLYAGIMLINKRMSGMDAYDKTIIELLISAVVMLLYCLVTGAFHAVASQITPMTAVMLVIVGIVHTGITYLLYFGAMEHIPGQSVAMISYIDPVVAIILSVTVLNDPVRPMDIGGGLLILAAAIISELPERRKEAIQ